MSEKALELLAPAGNLEILKAVVNAGADAVYFGGDLFGARAYANNFSNEDVLAGIEYAHLRSVKCNLTVNTLLKSKEIEDSLYDYIRPFYENGLDAVIVQDLGVFQYLKAYFPEMELHASTQMTLANSYGVRFLLDQGASRVVLARELSLQEISQIYQETGAEIEAFVHGALCMSYSGQCLMSSMLGGRSGNRGRCAQPCRLPYEVFEEGKGALTLPGNHVLSLKDLKGIQDIPALSESGVYSLKIEGRMKSLEYAAGVVSVYRKQIDHFYEVGAKDYCVLPMEEQKLFDFGNRSGFTNGYYYKQNGKDMISFEDPAHKKAEGIFQLQEEQKLPVDGSFFAMPGEAMSLSLFFGDQVIYKTSAVIETASKRATTPEEVEEKLRKTGNTPFQFQSLDITMDENCFIPLKLLNELRRDAFDELKTLLLGPKLDAVDKNNSFDSLQDAFPGIKESDKKSNTRTHSDQKQCESTNTINTFVSVMTASQLECLLEYDFITSIGLPYFLTADTQFPSWKEKAKEKGITFVVTLPYVLRKRGVNYLNTSCKDFFADDVYYEVSSFDGIQYLLDQKVEPQRMLLNRRLYTFNSYTLQVLENMGFQYFEAPLELNEKELRHRDNHHSQLLLYGRAPLMTMANCLNANLSACDQKAHLLFLKDRFQKSFPVLNDCSSCYNLVLNTVPNQLLTEMNKVLPLGFFEYRLDFTIESKEEIEELLELYQEAVFLQKTIVFPYEYTKGHFNRGVE